MFYFSLNKIIFLLHLLNSVDASPENFLHKHDHKIEKYRAKYDRHIKEFKKEKDPTILLIWWAPEYPVLNKIEDKCGGCWLTHEKHLYKKAAGYWFHFFLSVQSTRLIVLDPAISME